MESSHPDGGYYTFTIPRQCPNLILAGDIGSLKHSEAYSVFLQRHCETFDRVFLVLGNHEFYGISREAGLATAESFTTDPNMKGKLILLNRARYDIDDTLTILGCTLQSSILDSQRQSVSRALNDFNRIIDWTVDDHNAEHQLDVSWLRSQLEELPSNRRVLVITHHAPSYRKTSAPEHDDSPISSAFCTGILEGGEWRGWKGKEMVKSWVYGHTHWCADINFSGVRVVSNQRGYFFEQKIRSMFRDDFVLDA